MSESFFPPKPDDRPLIYAYTEPNNPELKDLLKVGYTTRTIEERMHEHYPTLKPGSTPYEVVFIEPGIRSDGTTFKDHDVHKNLEANGFKRIRVDDDKKSEWFCCTVDDVRAAWISVRDRSDNVERRIYDFKMRPEQEAAVTKTAAYYNSVNAQSPERTPKFLWNAKMRFGKTFATYQLAKQMDMKRVLVLTFKPAVQSAWDEDLATHMDFEGWQFVTREGKQFEECDPDRPIVCFGSFQDFLGVDSNTKGIKARNEWVHLEHWDMVVFDEYHFGAWKDSARSLFQQRDEDDFDDSEAVRTGNEYDETFLPIETDYYLFLSGTPFRALNSGEFIEEQVYNWTYSDEQEAKEKWPKNHPDESNPYEMLPRMVMLTYKVPDDIKRIALNSDTDEFDINLFFSAKAQDGASVESAQFVYKDHVQKWLDLIRGSHMPTTADELKLGEKPAMPFSDVRLLNVLNHTLWFLPNVASCFAMKNLLEERQNTFFHDYKINVCAGAGAGMGVDALPPVQDSMYDPITGKGPLDTRSITLSCGKLTTGVTVKPWTGVFMLRNLSSPETYFQTAFRVQSPWVIDGESGKEIVKQECYVFDFALDRALSMVSDYSRQLSVTDKSPEQKVGDFIRFLPVLAYDGSVMRQVNAAEILDIAMAGTSATLLARRWESALLVNVDNDTLARLLANEDAVNALMSIEGFRNLNDINDIRTVINKSEAVKKAKREGGDNLTKKEKKQLTEEEKEYKSKRKQIQEKLMKFATRIPVFMYLTEYREETLKDVITQLEPRLFKKVTGLDVKDFELLVSLGLFNDALMNDAVYKFRRYEDASLIYTGVNKHKEDMSVGLFDTKLSRFDYLSMAQEESIAPDEKPKANITKSETPPNGARSTSKQEKPNVSNINKESIDSTSNASGDDADWVIPVLEQADLEYIDKRPHKGSLWVIGGKNLAGVLKPLQDAGAGFKFKKDGGKATGYRDAWWLSGYPAMMIAEEEEAKPLITQEELESIIIDTPVFHKAFGYGNVVSISDSYIEVTFHNDDIKKKPSRKFIFPGAFLQGLLQKG